MIPKNIKTSFFVILFSIIFSITPSVAQDDPWSRAQINFWKNIYTEYTSQQFVIHDSMNLAHVYRVVSDHPDQARLEVIAALHSIYVKNKHRKSIDISTLTEPEERIFEVLESNEDPRSYDFASQPGRVRIQRGLKDALDAAAVISRQYLPRMEEMFIEEGVPKEITRLPFVESAFVQEAKSSAGAVGIWQFMPKTAIKNLRVTPEIDERYDPLKSTRAAAKFLNQNYKITQNWKLAIMAYHHGSGLVMKAVKRLKTRDPFKIIRYFKDPQFKFASRNYLFEWLAMVEVEPKHIALNLPKFIHVSFSKKRSLKEILKHFKLIESDIRLLNPHLRAPIWSGTRALPAHYPIRLSGITLEEFRKLEYSFK